MYGRPFHNVRRYFTVLLSVRIANTPLSMIFNDWYRYFVIAESKNNIALLLSVARRLLVPEENLRDCS